MTLICRYEGQFVEGKMHGEGTFTWPDGTSYQGQFNNGQMTGEGRCPNILKKTKWDHDFGWVTTKIIGMIIYVKVRGCRWRIVWRRRLLSGWQRQERWLRGSLWRDHSQVSCIAWHLVWSCSPITTFGRLWVCWGTWLGLVTISCLHAFSFPGTGTPHLRHHQRAAKAKEDTKENRQKYDYLPPNKRKFSLRTFFNALIDVWSTGKG